MNARGQGLGGMGTRENAAKVTTGDGSWFLIEEYSMVPQ